MMTGNAVPARGLTVAPLDASLVPPTRTLLEERPLQNLYFLSVLDHHRGREGALAARALVVLRDGHVAGAADCGRNLVVALADEADRPGLETLARGAYRLERGRHAVVGVRHLVRPFVTAYCRLGASLVEDRDQILFACARDQLLPADTGVVRHARQRELGPVLEAHSAMCLDDLGHDQVADNPDGYRQYFRELIREQRVWVEMQGHRVVFKAESSIETLHGAQVEGVFTAASHRGRGHALRGMTRVCLDLLRRVPAVTLYVNVHNRAGLRLYTKLGFRPVQDWCTAIVHVP